MSPERGGDPGGGRGVDATKNQGATGHGRGGRAVQEQGAAGGQRVAMDAPRGAGLVLQPGPE